MGRVILRDRLSGGVFVLDGAMGTQLIGLGVAAGVCNDNLNVASPAVVGQVHGAYAAAGSDGVLTNTFGANRYVLGRHGLAGEVAAINKAGAEVARGAMGEDGYVLGDIGPCGEFLAPLGTLTVDELRGAFVEQVEGLVAGGVDALMIETMTAVKEVEVAIDAAKSAGGGLPVFASMSFDAAGGDFRTMMGVDVERAVSTMVSCGADAVGFNCGTASLDEYIELAGRYVAAAGGVMVLAEPNAGRPDLVGDQAVYGVTGDEFAAAAAKICALGVRIIGGCCGTSPEHIGAVAAMVK